MNQTFKALADPTRREILRMLGEKSLTAGDIAEVFDISKPSISHHLRILKDAELVFAERDGQHIIYSLNSSVMQEIVTEIMSLFQVGKDEPTKEEKPDDRTTD
ncbi:MAG: autorepressor SdpR family transcription factor [Chloroflexota bacterium]